MAYLPAIWLMTGVVVLLFGFVPRLTFVAWVLLVGFLLVSELGRAALVAGRGHGPVALRRTCPQLPAAAMDWTPIVVLLVIAAALMAAGAAAFRRRDLSTP